jgi:hypothetical protein
MSYLGNFADDAKAHHAPEDLQRQLFKRSIERIVSIAGLDIDAINVFAAGLNQASRQATNKLITAGNSQAAVDSYFLRLADGSKGVLQVCGVCPAGSGERLELYGMKGMLMLTRPAHRPFGYCLTGARVDVQDILNNATPPEKLKRKFAPLRIPTSLSPSYPVNANKPWFGEAQTLSAFAKVVSTGRSYSPNLADRFRLSCVADAADRARSVQKWSTVKYKNIARADENV